MIDDGKTDEVAPTCYSVLFYFKHMFTDFAARKTYLSLPREKLLPTLNYNGFCIFLVVCSCSAVNSSNTLSKTIGTLRLYGKEAVLTLNPCKLFLDTTYYSDFTVRQERLAVRVRTIHAICGLRVPSAVVQRKSIFCLRLDFLRFIDKVV